MELFKSRNKILISCPQRISAYLRKEVESFGYTVTNEKDTYIETEGTMEDVMRLNLLVRTGHRVLFYLSEFEANTPEKLYKGIYKIEWEKYFGKLDYFSVSSHVEHESVNDSRFPNLKAKDAIADRFRDKYGVRPDSGSERKGVMIFVYWVNNKCTVYFDTSGVTLSKRNYRKIP
ncbi:MAG: THUMP domain-containing protein, partial [Clostridiales bacterium]